MKRRTSSSLKKTVSKTALSSTAQSKKKQNTKIPSKDSSNDSNDHDQESPLSLETFQPTDLPQTTDDTQTQEETHQKHSLMVESEEFFMDYDPDIMDEIEKEIYEAEFERSISPIDKLKNIEDECTNDQETFNTLTEKVKKIQSKEILNMKSSKETKKTSSKLSSKKENLNQSIETEKIVSESEEESIVVPKKSTEKQAVNEVPPEIQVNKPEEQTGNSNRNSKLKSSENSKEKFKIFTINIELLRGQIPVKKVLKCLESNEENDRWKAKFLIESENSKQEVLSNQEMVYFYKDPLIDYYQGIHFS